MIEPHHLTDDPKERCKYAVHERNFEYDVARENGLLYAAVIICLVGALVFKGAARLYNGEL